MTGRVWTLELPFDRPPLTLNQRLHWAKRSQANAQLKQAAYMLAKAARIPELGRCSIELHWQPAVRRHRDDDNPHPTVKALADGIAKAIGVPDTADRMTKLATVIHTPVPSRARMWVIVTELPARVTATRGVE